MNETTDQASIDGYLAGASAVRTETGWIALHPCTEQQAETVEELDGCAIITSDNPWAEKLNEDVNHGRRAQLRQRLAGEYATLRETLGGRPAEHWPWPGSEHGYCARMSREEAASIGREHDQEAVYVIEGNKRILVFCDERDSIEQYYRTESLDDNQRTAEGAP